MWIRIELRAATISRGSPHCELSLTLQVVEALKVLVELCDPLPLFLLSLGRQVAQTIQDLVSEKRSQTREEVRTESKPPSIARSASRAEYTVGIA